VVVAVVVSMLVVAVLVVIDAAFQANLRVLILLPNLRLHYYLKQITQSLWVVVEPETTH
jgi:hypothetical protein